MRLKHKIYYIAIGVILLAVFQVGFQLIPRLAFADSHGAHEAESKPEPSKNLYLVRFAPKEGMLQDQIHQFATSDFEAQDKMMESMGTTAISYHASDMSGVVIVEGANLDFVTQMTLPWRATFDMDIAPAMSRDAMQEACKKVSAMMQLN